jgi:hypothetical protein
MASEIRPGSHVLVLDHWGRWLPRVATSGPTKERFGDVVWVCREEEWGAAQAEARRAWGIPWPAKDVTVVESR